jgi:hypothetical protein
MVPENKETEDTNKLTLLAFKIIAIIHNSHSWIAAVRNSCSAIDS